MHNLKHSVFSLLSKLLTGFLLSALLTACGFHLRGAYQLPQEMNSTYIDAQDENSDLVRSLKRSLKASGVNLLEEALDEAAVLKVAKAQKSKRIVSVDSRGKAREYTLTYAIVFSVRVEQTDFEMSEQTISINRDFLFDTEDVLGNSREEAQLYTEMQQDAVRLMLLRLQSKTQK